MSKEDSMWIQMKMPWLGAGLFAGLVAIAPQASADKAKPSVEVRAPELSLDTIVAKHIAALGGADVLRATKTMSYVVTGEKAGKKFTKTAYFARPGKMRVDFESDEGKGSKGFDGKVAWARKPGEAAAVALGAEDTAMVKAHAEFDEPLLDYAKRGISVKLIGTSEVAGKPAYELELTKPSGDVERHFIDAGTFLPAQRTWTVKKDGKVTTAQVRFGDYRKVQGRMINHSVEFSGDGYSGKSVVSQVTFDRPFDAALFTLPRP
jgi:outer membrane lipoprotein-sorting protein